MRVPIRRLVTATWSRGIALAAIMALVVQPCFGCITGSSAAEALAAPPDTTGRPGDCHAAGPMTHLRGDRVAAPVSAESCPSLSARGPDAYVPTATIPLLPVPAAPAATAIPAPSFEDRSTTEDGLRNDPVPLFLRHASFRI